MKGFAGATALPSVVLVTNQEIGTRSGRAGCIFQACMKGFAGATALPSVVLVTNQEIGTRSGRAGPAFSVRPEKEAKGAVLHGTSAAGS